MTPVEFQIHIEDADLQALQARLGQARYPDSPAGAGWLYGVDLDVLKDYASYWQEQFNWREQEKILNRWDHFMVNVSDLDIHYIHQKSPYENAIPILLLHGWPSSFMQMLGLARELAMTATPELSFHVVIPSLPGYGFSGAPENQGFGTRQSAAVIHKLMSDVLGYRRYAVRGGDIGKLVADWLCNDYPDDILGAHLAEIILPGPMAAPEDASEAEREFLANNNLLWQGEMSYCLQHMTKPQTLAVGLNDSPIGLLAWILEKFHSWSGVDRDLSEKFSKDELLTNVTLYWITRTISSSIRIYYEFCREDFSLPRLKKVPVGFCQGRRDLFPQVPEDWARRFYQVVYFNCCDTGGHFLEWDSPAFVARDIQKFMQKVISFPHLEPV